MVNEPLTSLFYVDQDQCLNLALMCPKVRLGTHPKCSCCCRMGSFKDYRFWDIGMFAWKNKTCDIPQGETVLPKLDARKTGLVAGTKVATTAGWAKVETIAEGQQVLTFDGGLQTVVAITRHVLMTDTTEILSWPLLVPCGAFGNRDDMNILPHQSIMVESDAADALRGDPFAIIRAATFVGFRGITYVRSPDGVEVIQLHFARDEIVFANVGALFLCHAQENLMSDMGSATYEVLAMDAAEDLVDLLSTNGIKATGFQPVRFSVMYYNLPSHF
jgi:hypothetical protein